MYKIILCDLHYYYLHILYIVGPNMMITLFRTLSMYYGIEWHCLYRNLIAKIKLTPALQYSWITFVCFSFRCCVLPGTLCRRDAPRSQHRQDRHSSPRSHHKVWTESAVLYFRNKPRTVLVAWSSVSPFASARLWMFMSVLWLGLVSDRCTVMVWFMCHIQCEQTQVIWLYYWSLNVIWMAIFI